MFMAHKNEPIPRLYTKSDWWPPIHMVNYNLVLRVNNFVKRIEKLYTKKKCRSNLLPYQRRILATIKTNKTHVVMPADKNLGPCIIERYKYITRALNDHLLDATTYKPLHPLLAQQRIDRLQTQLQQFIEYYGKRLSPPDVKFLTKTLHVKDPYPKFYITAKVHKTPWKTRPIVSVSGSLLDGLGRWVDKLLQPYFAATPFAVKSSTTLKDLVIDLPPLPPSARLFTADAVSMYTNIDTTHALSVIPKFIRRHQQEYGNANETTALIEGLELVMRNNIFQFGDTFWHQINGTAMGVSPSCMYATLYYAMHEETLIQQFPELFLYKRYIDDVFGIWIPKTLNDEARWQLFQQQLTYGRLQWEVSERTTITNFLDLTLILQPNGRIRTKLYEKPENLYLYLPAQSAHPFGNLKGLIHGMVYRSIRLTSDIQDQSNELQNLVRRLVTRGYRQKYLVDIINKTYQRLSEKSQSNTPTQEEKATQINNTCFFHSFYHPNDPKSSALQQAFQEELYKPRNMYKTLENLLNHRKANLGVNRMIIAYHRTPNLGNLLSSRVMKKEDGPPVSSFIG
jgi:hypothetical protein